MAHNRGMDESKRNTEPAGAGVGGVWSASFWLLLATGGWGIGRLSSAQIRVADHSYVPKAMGYGTLLGVVCWLGVCLAGYVAERSLGRRVFTGEARERFAAVGPIVGVVIMALLAEVAGASHFVFLPLTAAAVGLSAGRLAAAVGGAKPWGKSDSSGRARGALVLMGIASVGAAMAWSAQMGRMYAGGHLGYFDTGTFASRLANTVRWTFPFRENGGVAAFWDHFNPGFYLLTPLAAWFDPAHLLIVTQACATAGASMVWFLLARRKGLSGIQSVAVGVAWLALPSVSQMNFSLARGFHPVLLAVPLVALSLYLFSSERFVAAACWAVLACSMRETVSLVYAGLGLWLLTVPGRRKGGAVLLAVAVGYLALAAGTIIPAFGGEEYPVADRLGHLGDSLWEVLVSPFAAPGAFWAAVLNKDSLVFALVVLCTFGLAPVVMGGRRLVALLPGAGLLLLWSDPRLRSICFHYHAMILTILFWIVLESVSRRGRRQHVWTLLGAALTGGLFLGWWPVLRDTTPFDRDPSRGEEMAFVREQIGGEDRVVASICAAAHCVGAAEVRVMSDFDAEGEWPDAFVLDYADDWGQFDLARWLPEIRGLHRRLMESSYVLAGSRGAIAVYRGGGYVQGSTADEAVSIPVEAILVEPVRLTEALSVVGVRLGLVESGATGDAYGRVRVDVYLRADRAPETDWGMVMALVDSEQADQSVSTSLVRPAGGMEGSSLWRLAPILGRHNFPVLQMV